MPRDDASQSSDPHAAAGRITRLLGEVRGGRSGAESELLGLVYQELREIAGRAMAGVPAHATLQPTALVNEAYARFAGRNGLEGRDRREFFSLMARAMRDVLVEHARSRLALKRGGGHRHLQLTGQEAIGAEHEPEALLDLAAAIERLRDHDATATEVVMLRYFGGLTYEQIAALLDLPVIRCRREWEYARACLHRDLAGGRAGPREKN